MPLLIDIPIAINLQVRLAAEEFTVSGALYFQLCCSDGSPTTVNKCSLSLRGFQSCHIRLHMHIIKVVWCQLTCEFNMIVLFLIKDVTLISTSAWNGSRRYFGNFHTSIVLLALGICEMTFIFCLFYSFDNSIYVTDVYYTC